jgi:hypothetical protein
MLKSSAWKSLTANARAIYIEMASRYGGPGSNNGRIPYSVRDAAKSLKIGKSTHRAGSEHAAGRPAKDVVVIRSKDIWQAGHINPRKFSEANIVVSVANRANLVPNAWCRKDSLLPSLH